MRKHIFLVLIFSFLLVNGALAKSSDLFIDYLTDEVYSDCVGKDLNIKEPFIQNTLTNKSVTLVPWPYDKSTLRRIIELLGNYEPWDFFQGTCENRGVSIGGSKNGCSVLSCGDNKLDINQFTYFWNDERVDIPREEFTTVYGDNIETHGDESPVTTGDNSPINQNKENIWIQLFWSKGTIAGAILGFLLKILYDILKKKYFSKKKRRKKS